MSCGYRLTKRDVAVLSRACEIREKMLFSGEPLPDPAATKSYFLDRFAAKRREVFAVLYLDNQHRPIKCREEFKGTINSATVYPREIVRFAIETGAAAVIFAHNHPSGVAEPSSADRDLTQRLKDALALIDVRVLDHIVIGSADAVSFAERGLL